MRELRDEKAFLAILKWAYDEIDAVPLTTALDNDTKQACEACIATLMECVKCGLVDTEGVLTRYGAITSKENH